MHPYHFSPFGSLISFIGMGHIRNQMEVNSLDAKTCDNNSQDNDKLDPLDLGEFGSAISDKLIKNSSHFEQDSDFYPSLGSFVLSIAVVTI